MIITFLSSIARFSGEAAAPCSGELFAVFPGAAIPASGFTSPQGRATAQNYAQDNAEHIPHVRPPQVAAGGLNSHPDGASPAGYFPQGIYKRILLPVHVSSVNSWLILLNAGCNGQGFHHHGGKSLPKARYLWHTEE
jgi:hypothetical protein